MACVRGHTNQHCIACTFCVAHTCLLHACRAISNAFQHLPRRKRHAFLAAASPRSYAAMTAVYGQDQVCAGVGGGGAVCGGGVFGRGRGGGVTVTLNQSRGGGCRFGHGHACPPPRAACPTDPTNTVSLPSRLCIHLYPVHLLACKSASTHCSDQMTNAPTRPHRRRSRATTHTQVNHLLSHTDFMLAPGGAKSTSTDAKLLQVRQGGTYGTVRSGPL